MHGTSGHLAWHRGNGPPDWSHEVTREKGRADQRQAGAGAVDRGHRRQNEWVLEQGWGVRR